LLLEKAYASMLGCYEAVHEYSTVEYFNQLMGLPVHRLNL
jgi:hypothetical protein